MAGTPELAAKMTTASTMTTTTQLRQRRRNATAGGMTELERRFAAHFLVDFNATEAYAKASRGRASRATAMANGHRLLQRPDIQALIRAERDRLLAGAELSAADVLKQLKRSLFYDIRKLFDENDRLLPMKLWPDDVAAAVVGIKDTITGREIKMADKVSALDKAMKYLGLFERDNRQSAEAVTEVVFRLIGTGSKPAPASVFNLPEVLRGVPSCAA